MSLYEWIHAGGTFFALVIGVYNSYRARQRNRVKLNVEIGFYYDLEIPHDDASSLIHALSVDIINLSTVPVTVESVDLYKNQYYHFYKYDFTFRLFGWMRRKKEIISFPISFPDYYPKPHKPLAVREKMTIKFPHFHTSGIDYSVRSKIVNATGIFVETVCGHQVYTKCDFREYVDPPPTT